VPSFYPLQNKFVFTKKDHQVDEKGILMAKIKRHKTQYPGVYYIMGKSPITGKDEKIFYIRYRRDGKQIEEKAGRQSVDDMTAARAASLRGVRMEGKEPSNVEQRKKAKKDKQDKQNKWTLSRLYKQYRKDKPTKDDYNLNNSFTLYLEPPFGDKEPKDIDPLSVARLRRNLLKEKAPATVYNIMEILRRIINYGAKNNLIPKLPFVIELPTVDNEKTEDLTPAQLDRLMKVLEAEKGSTIAQIMKLVLFTGMRRGEVFKLKWDDLDFEKGFITLSKPKGGKTVQIPMNETARQVFESTPRTSDYVFPGLNGMKRTTIKKPANRIKKAARLPKDFRPLHGLRHLYASMLASSGQVDMYTLQKLLTHKSPEMTQRYAHLRDDTLRRAANLAGDIINQAINENKVVNLKTKKKK
jgi:integrase